MVDGFVGKRRHYVAEVFWTKSVHYVVQCLVKDFVGALSKGFKIFSVLSNDFVGKRRR